METKTYKAETMLEALQMVQAELGPDAIVLSAREAPAGAAWGLWKRPGVEVVAAPAGALGDKITRTLNAAAPKARKTRDSAVPMPENGEAAQIEWVTGPEPRRAQIPVYPPAPKTSSSWQPRHITKEEAQQANSAPRQPEKPARPEPELASAEAMKAIATILETVKNASASAAATTPAPAAAPTPAAPAAAVVPAAAPEKAAPLSKAMTKVRQQMLDQGIEEAVIERIFKVAREMFSLASLQDEDVCRKYVAKLLEAEIREQTSATFTAAKRVVCLAGPSGSGKTSTAAKMALFYSQKLGRKVVWICADTLRTGAIAEARAYTDALNLPLKLAYTPADLHAAVIEASQSADLVLVDTPGYNPYQEEQMVELGNFLTEVPNRSTYLAAPANLKEADLNRAAAALSIFGLEGIIVTKLDETISYGSVYNFARKSQLPLGYFTSGKGAEGAFQAATTSRLVSALFGKGWAK